MMALIFCNPTDNDQENNDNTRDPIFDKKYNALELDTIGIFYDLFKRSIYPDPSDTFLVKNKILPRKELLLNIDDEFKITIQNCKSGNLWRTAVEDSAIELLKRDSIGKTDNSYDVSFLFKAKKSCKGYIGFAEWTYDMRLGFHILSSDAPGLIISYTCNPVSSYKLELSDTTWIYDTTGWSCLRLFLSGNTNAYKIKVETYGDGLVNVSSIFIDENGDFSDTISIAFSAVNGIFLKHNARIGLYGMQGYPKILEIKNPRLKY